MPVEQSHEKFARYEREDESARRDEQRIEAAKKEHWIRDAEAEACARIADALAQTYDDIRKHGAFDVSLAIRGRILRRTEA